MTVRAAIIALGILLGACALIALGGAVNAQEAPLAARMSPELRNAIAECNARPACAAAMEARFEAIAAKVRQQ